MKILYITYGLPYPPNSGVRIHDFNIIKQISTKYSVHVLSLLYEKQEVEWLPTLRKFCDSCDVVFMHKRSFKEQLTESLQGFFSGRPLACHPFIYSELMQKIQQTIESKKIDMLQIEHSFLAPYVEAVPEGHPCKKILSFQNLGGRQYQSMVQMRLGLNQKLLFTLKAFLMQGWEAVYAQKFDLCLVVSEKENELLANENASLKIKVVENGVDTDSITPLPVNPNGNRLLFVGTMSYPPNADAIMDFCQNTLPLIRKKSPDVKLLIVGQNPPPRIRKLAEHSNVIVTGEVDDLKPYYEQSQVVIVPLRAGGGTRLKILEAMAFGRPVVSTRLGCEGLRVHNNYNILIADKSNEFAEYVVQLLDDKKKGEVIAGNARKLVETEYDWQVIGQKLSTVYKNLIEQYPNTEKECLTQKKVFCGNYRIE